MPDEDQAATEHAIMQEITAPLATLPDDAMSQVTDVDFPLVLRGYDRLAVDAYVRKTTQLVAELQATRSPEAAVRRALERVGEQISGILQRAHESAAQITEQSRREAEDRLEVARGEAAAIVQEAERRIRELDSDTDRIWAERHRIVGDARNLAEELYALAESAAERFPETADGPEGPVAGEGAELRDAANPGELDETVAMPPIYPAERQAVEPEAIDREVDPGAVDPEAIDPEAVEPEVFDPETVDPEADTLGDDTTAESG